MPETTEHRSAPGTTLRGREAVRNAFSQLVTRAQRELTVFAVRPDPFYFDESFTAGLATFAARHGHNHARLLVDDAARFGRDHTRLAEVVRRLSDAIQLREIGEYDRGRCDLFLLRDRREYLTLEDGAAIEGRTGEARREAVTLSEAFEAMWERGTPAALRPLGL